MELVEGHVRLTFDLGSGALILASSRKYNTGVWYKITLQRNKRKGTTIMNTAVLILLLWLHGCYVTCFRVSRVFVHYGS